MDSVPYWPKSVQLMTITLAGSVASGMGTTEMHYFAMLLKSFM